MNAKRNNLLLGKENSDEITFPGNMSSLELEILRRCNSLPVFISNNMYCESKEKSRNKVLNRFLAKELHHQSFYLTDACRFNLNPFNNIDSETKSLEELQTEVDKLIEFRNIVIETFPDLKTKILMRSAVSSQRYPSNEKKLREKSYTIGEAVPPFISRSLSNSNCCKKEPKSGEGCGSTVQDSGFSTETTSSKDCYSASASSGGLQGTNNASNHIACDTDDELLNLLDVIFRKTSRFRRKCSSLPQYECDKQESNASSSSACFANILNSSSVYPIYQRFNTNYSLKQSMIKLNKERDKLLLQVAELESEIVKNQIKIFQMEKKMNSLTSGCENLEEQLKANQNEKQEINFELSQSASHIPSPRYDERTPSIVALKRPREISMKRQHLKSVTRKTSGEREIDLKPSLSSSSISKSPSEGNNISKLKTSSENLTTIGNTMRVFNPSNIKLNPDFVPKNSLTNAESEGKLNGVFTSQRRPSKTSEINSTKIAAILLETNPLELQKQLLKLAFLNKSKKFHPEPSEPRSIPTLLKKKSPQRSNSVDKSPSQHLTNSSASSRYKSSEFIKDEGKLSDSLEIFCNNTPTPTEWDKTIRPVKRPKPSRIPLLGCKTSYSSKSAGYVSTSDKSSPFISINKTLSLSPKNHTLKSSRLNGDDSLTLKLRASTPSLAATDSKITSPGSIVLSSSLTKSSRNLDTHHSFLQLNSLTKSKKIHSKNNEYIKTDKKQQPPVPSRHHVIQNKYSIPVISLPIRNDNGKPEPIERSSIKNGTKVKTETTECIEYLGQPGVQLLIGGIKKNNYRSSITNSLNNNSMTEDEPFTDEQIGKVRNLRSTLLGWLKI